MDHQHKTWLEERELLTKLMKQPEQHAQAVEVFLHLHAGVHAGAVTGADAPTFDDEALSGLSEANYRRQVKGLPHSAAWLVWHITRCEDITLTLLIAGSPQVFNQGWAEKVCAPSPDTGNSLDAAALAAFNASVDIGGLLGYRAAVTLRTREIVRALQPGDFARKVAPERIQRVADEHAVAPADVWLLKYWGGRTTAGLLLMPATRHPLMHLDEIVKLRKKLSAVS
jgi:hypothetical protein